VGVLLTVTERRIELPADDVEDLRRGIERHAAMLPPAAFAATVRCPRRTFSCRGCSLGWMAGQDAVWTLSGPSAQGPESAPPPS
jgi:hypothetical protein